MRRLYLPTVLVLLVLAGSVAARTWYVSSDGTGDAPTIQAGIDSAVAGDTVLLANGTYGGVGNRNIRYRGKPITVRSESADRSLCVVDCSYRARGFIFDPGDGPGCVLDGVTVTRGLCHEPAPPADSGGAGIWCDAASPTIRNVRVRDCFSYVNGGGVWCSGGSCPTLTDVVIDSNFAFVGGGMFCRESSPILTDVTFRDNDVGTAGGGMFCEGGSPQMIEVEFAGNFGDLGAGGLELKDGCEAELTNVTFTGNTSIGHAGGIYCSASSPQITSCVFWRNWGTLAGGIQLMGNSSPVIIGCTFFENRGDEGGGLGCYGESSPVLERTIIAGSTSGGAIFPDCPDVILSCCDIYGNVGGDWTGCVAAQYGTNGNISADPLFCDTADGDFSLQACSPCLPGNHPDRYDCGDVIGAFGEGCACGAPTEPVSWGTIKAMYR
jgi:hypothetical protein